jgi:hypothetical protein
MNLMSPYVQIWTLFVAYAIVGLSGAVAFLNRGMERASLGWFLGVFALTGIAQFLIRCRNCGEPVIRRRWKHLPYYGAPIKRRCAKCGAVI